MAGHKFKGHWQDGEKARQTGKIFCRLTPNHKTLLWGGEDVETSSSSGKRIAVSDISSVDLLRDKIVLNYSDQGVPKELELELDVKGGGGAKEKNLLLEYWTDGLR